MGKKHAICLVLSLLVTSCSNITANNPVHVEGNILSSSEVKDFTKINGQVQWPEGFKTKAGIDDVAPAGTVSLLYPHDHPTMSNKTVATGLTDSMGRFTINPTVTFTPQPNQIFTLEVVKRLGGAKNSLLSLRTFIRWKGNGWESMTAPALYINTKTTALAIISDLEGIPADKTIGAINTSTGTSVPEDIDNSPEKVVWQGQIEMDETTSHIYVGNADGSGTQVKLSADTSSNLQPKFSSDGTRIIWVGNDGTSNHIYARDTDSSGTPVKISEGTTENNDAWFSPDDSKITWSSMDTATNISHVYIRNADGSGTPVKISTDNSNGNARFSPNGSKITWSSMDSTTFISHIYVRNVDLTDTPVKISTDESLNYMPQFSPNGSKIAWVSMDLTTSASDIYVRNADGTGTTVTVATNHLITEPPQFSPDSSKILWNDGTANIYVGDTSGTEAPVIISADSVMNKFPQFSPDSNKVIWEGYNTTTHQTQIYIANADGTDEPFQISQGMFYNYKPKFSPDGTKAVWSRHSGNTGDIYVGNIDGTGDLVKVSTDTTLYNNSPSFSPVGLKTLVTASKITDVADLVTEILGANYDPVRFIDYNNGTYTATYPKPGIGGGVGND